MSSNSRPVVFHPLLAGLYPLLALLGHNIAETTVSSALRAALASLLVAAFLWLFFTLLLRDYQKAALLATLTLVLFFSYGHFNAAFPLPIRLFSLPLRSHRVLAPLYILAFLLGAWLVVKRLSNAKVFTMSLNYVTAIIMFVPLYQLGMYQLGQFRSLEAASSFETQLADLDPEQKLPDIYLIILDMYPRADFLRDVYGFDNTQFLNTLDEMGFYVAECSQSNYQHTRMTLSSMLNFDYIQSFIPEYVDFNHDGKRLDPFITNSLVLSELESRGYSTVAFGTGFGWTELRDADYFLEPDLTELAPHYWQLIDNETIANPFGRLLLRSNLNEFEWLFLSTTAIKLPLDVLAASEEGGVTSEIIPRIRKYHSINFILDELAQLPDLHGPKFVFAHVILPHPIFPFTADGGLLLEEKDESEAFPEQIIYLNSRLPEIFESIISKSSPEPIIVLMGDHGPAPPGSGKKTTEILNVYYLPDGGENDLYPTISPVNTFRQIFSRYFDAAYPLLEDVSYYSRGKQIYEFYPVENNRSDCDLRFP